jgi:hypothetical protein
VMRQPDMTKNRSTPTNSPNSHGKRNWKRRPAGWRGRATHRCRYGTSDERDRSSHGAAWDAPPSNEWNVRAAGSGLCRARASLSSRWGRRSERSLQVGPTAILGRHLHLHAPLAAGVAYDYWSYRAHERRELTGSGLTVGRRFVRCEHSRS